MKDDKIGQGRLILEAASGMHGEVAKQLTAIYTDWINSLASPATPAVPADWVMVPREPTEVMVLAASMAWDSSGAGLYDSFAAALRGGIQAAPGSAPAAPAVQPLTQSESDGFGGSSRSSDGKWHG